MEFYPMQSTPKIAVNLWGESEDFSVPVLVYDKDNPKFCEIGHYNYDTKMWSHFGDNSMRLICWCYLPNPKEFLKDKDLKCVKHEGYCE